MDGWVPDSIRYVPGLGVVQVNAVVAPAATSVENDCTRCPCAGGVKVAELTVDHVTEFAPWAGLSVAVAVLPRPAPNWPTITSEVGMVFAVVLLVGVNDRLFVRLIVRL
jgi:hypothetical protein